MKSMLVIGLGRFGRNLAIYLADLGIKVIVIDKDEEKVNKIAHYVYRAYIGNCTDKNTLQPLKVHRVDKCFVCISGSLQASLEINTLLKELGAVYVICKTDRDLHKNFLLKSGADEVIYVERAAAQRTAKKYSVNNAFEYIELTDEYAISEILVPEDWVGLSLKTLDLRATHNINVIGIKDSGKVVAVTDPNHILTQQEHLIVAGYKADIYCLLDK